MTRLKTMTAAGGQAPAATGLSRGSSFSTGRRAARVLLCSSVLAGGLFFVNLAGVAPAYAVACTGALDGANATLCLNGATADTLTYVVSNTFPYTTGNFTLSLDDHDVTGTTDGIEFSGVVNGDGFIELEDDSDVTGTAGNGIEAQADGSNTTIDIQDTSTVSGTLAGINAQSFNAGGNVTVNTEVGTTVSGGVLGVGILANAEAAGNVVVNAQGAVTSPNFAGIFTSATTGTVGVTTGAVAISGGTFGIDANAAANTVTVTTGTGAVSATGGTGIEATSATGTTVTANGNVTGTGGAGILAETAQGNTTVATVAASIVTGTAGNGITANVTGTGFVDVDALGTVTGSTNGIVGTAADGTASVTTGTATVTGNAGVGIDAEGALGATVNAGGNVTGTGGSGIIALAQNGNVEVDTAATFTVSGTTGGGIVAIAAITGNVDVNALSAVSGSTNGILATTADGTVQVITGTAAITGNGGTGVNATGSDGVNVVTGGNVTGTGGVGINAVAATGGVTMQTAANTTVSGTGGDGINAEATTSGNVQLTIGSDTTGSAIGIDADAVAGTVEVTTSAGAEVIGNAGNGIDATASGAVTVLTGANVTGTGGTGINAVSSAAGIVNATTGAGTDVTGTTGDGINAATTGAGTILINNNSDTRGFDTGIEATSGGGAIVINNSDLIANTTLDDGALAIRTAGGATTINNNLRIIGRVETDAGVFGDVLNTNSLWQTEGISDFGGGNDTVNNNFIINGANELGVAETTSFANLETLNNNFGAIDLSEQTAGDGSNISDRLSTSGNYVGTNGNGSLNVDAFLGGPGSLADVLAVGGSTSGQTTIFVVADTNPGAGAFNPTGILVVDGVAGNTAAEHFVLNGGPIDKGLFVYDLLFDEANGDHLLVGLPDREVFETTAAVASSQEIWRETADAWSTRQENLRDTLAASHMVTAVADPGVTTSDAPMGSLWVSALGSWSERDDEASFSILNANLEFDLGYSQDIYGVVGGADFGMDMGSSSRFLFGVMAGYVDSSLDFDEGSTSIDTDGATVGAYAALMSNGFFATVLVKGDLLSMDYSTADDDDDADVTSIGARGDLGYRFGNTLFVEPMLSVDAISTKIDDFTIAGADIDAGTNESFRAGAGLRAGYGGETFRASATARVWDVFSTDNEVDIVSGGVPLGISDDDLEGVYGDFSGQIDVNLTTNTTVYLKGGVLISDDVTKPNASGGFALYW